MDRRLCLTEFGYSDSERLCDCDSGHNGPHVGPLVGSMAGDILRDLKAALEELEERPPHRFVTQWPHVSGLYAVIDQEYGVVTATFPSRVEADAVVTALRKGWVHVGE
jgi:hypothetical protein